MALIRYCVDKLYQNTFQGFKIIRHYPKSKLINRRINGDEICVIHAEKGHQFLLWKGLLSTNDASGTEDLVGRTQSPGYRTLLCILQRQEDYAAAFVFYPSQ